MFPLEANVCVLYLARTFVGKPKQFLQSRQVVADRELVNSSQVCPGSPY